MPGIDVGVDATVSIAGISVPANISGTGPDNTRSLQPIVLALGLANNLVGYSPSSGAKSGFAVLFDIPYSLTAANLAAMLNTAGVAVAMQFGSAGGVSLANCQWFDCQLSGTVGSGNISAKIMYESGDMPIVGATVASPSSSLDVYKGTEIVSCKGVSGTTYTDVDSFTLALTRNLAKAGRNNPTGRPKHLKGTRVEAKMTAKYLKVDDSEGTAFMAGGAPNYCPTIGDMVVILTQACPPGGSPASLTLTASNCLYDTYPATTGNTEDFIWETVTGFAQKGSYSFS